MDWQDIESAPNMMVLWLHHPYYSHGQMRQGYYDTTGHWIGVNADGTERELGFSPISWQPLPQPPTNTKG